MTLAPGAQLGPYEIEAEIGRGGMGVVYRARDPRLKRAVAIKLLPPELTSDATAKRRFLQEAQSASALDHPNICTVHEVNETDASQLYLVMAHYEGETLKDRIARGPLPLDEAIDVAEQVGFGLERAHAAGIVHRDIKPANLMVTADGTVKILDFGLAKLAGSEGVTQTGTTVGTVAYMSPEQARGEEVDQRTDIWSLGVVLYEMLAGEPPFRGENLLAISKAILEGQPPPLPRASVSMEPVIGRSLNKSREQRYQAITDLLDELWTTGGGSDATAPKSAEPTVPSIAVLPFANMSADPEQEYFCDGMAEEIINALSPIDGMRVVARTSAFAFKGRHEDVREIGKQLGVTHLLEGSVRKAGTRLRITAQLTSVSDGYQMWSQRFERTMEDVFAVQDQISAAIVERLSADLKGRVPARPSGQRRPQNLAAYDAYLRGRFHWAKGTLEGYTKSIECFEQAVAEDPGYALAYAGLSDACSWFAFLGSKSAEEMAPKAKQAALEAVALDGELAEAHTSLGSVKFYFDWDWHGADREFRRAIELNPDSAVSLQAYEVFLANLGHVDEAIETVKRALELDPLWSKANQDLGFHLCLQKRYDEAIAQLKRTVEIDPNFPLTHFCLGMTYLETGELAPAIEAFRRGFESGGGPFPRTGLAIGYARSGRKTDALTILRRMQELAKEDREPVHIAWVLASLGEKASALDSLEDAYAQRAPMLISMPTFPWWDPLRADPRFEALLRRMNFPETAAAD